ncbi:hypothetical protein FNW25_08925 [Flavobacterium franklandianum]|uniref:hypothetical protein n=1 Tax=Flavobacterium franklandianum TaxID=2594430 RepID=UPI00117B7F8D|nr:hypothetical protein [Flavobacterium franklandianum]TRX25546.1 hypothetical protein FNW25_08925 [Flavobacterium franklandianum]
MKLQLNKIVEVLSKMKDDEFYFKNYAPEIIESYADEKALQFLEWCDENRESIYKLSSSEKMVAFMKTNRNNLT